MPLLHVTVIVPRPARHVETFPSFNRINTAINLCVADKQRYKEVFLPFRCTHTG
jgi:hypothetical protein